MSSQNLEHAFEQEQNLPDFVKYPKIPYLETCSEIFGHEGYIFEKIDGALSQVRNTSRGLVGGSKSNYLSGNLSRPHWAQEFLKWMHSNKSLLNLPRNLILYGEWLSPVTVDYDPSVINKFYLNDLAFIEEGKPIFFDYLEAADYLQRWGIKDVEVLPPIEKELFDESVIERLVNHFPGNLGSNEVEGVVLKSYALQIFAKALNPRYSEIREQEKTLERKYVNLPRVRKALERIDERGIKHPSLDILVDEIVRDIKEETGNSFSNSAVKGVVRVNNYFRPNKPR